jgi:hypothetical protein
MRLQRVGAVTLAAALSLSGIAVRADETPKDSQRAEGVKQQNAATLTVEGMT